MTSEEGRRAHAERARRPFWLHQAAEYLVGLVLVAQGLQSPTPLVPALAGGVVIANAALVDGPLGAFRAVPRRIHRIVDLVVIAGLVLVAALPWLDVDNTSRLLVVVVAVVLAFVWWHTSFERSVRRTGGSSDRSEAIGRWAGRTVAGASKAVRDRRPR